MKSKLNKTNIIEALKSNKEILAKEFSILRIGLFGSYSTNTFTENSDIDLIYQLKEGQYLGLKEIVALEAFFKQMFKVEKIDLVNQQYLNPIIENGIRKTVIYV